MAKSSLDGNVAALRIHEQEQESAVRNFDYAGRLEHALSILHDGEELAKVIESSFLAPHIAEALAGLEAACKEVRNLPKDWCPITKLVLQRLVRLERELFNHVSEQL